MRRNSGLTMMEMLVVIGICSVMALLLVPALCHARTRARAVTCADKLKALGQAYAICLTESNGVLPDAYYGYSGSSGTYQVSLQTAQSGQPDRFFTADISESLTCPADSKPVGVLARNALGSATVIPSSYAYNIALPLIFRNVSRVASPVNTVTFFDGDVSGVVGTWSYSGNWAASAVRARHSGQANFLYLDGHVMRPDGFPTAAFDNGQCWVASSRDTNIAGDSISSGTPEGSSTGLVQPPPEPVQPPVPPSPPPPPPPPPPVYSSTWALMTFPVRSIKTM
jgi:prepilin-type processing-associated H-X9-DG protein